MFKIAHLCLDEFESGIELQFEENDVTNKSKLERWLTIGDFKHIDNSWIFTSPNEVQLIKMINDVKNKCSKLEIELQFCPKVTEKINFAFGTIPFEESMKKGQKIKDFCFVCNELLNTHTDKQLSFCQKEFKPNISSTFKRELNPEQKNSVQHILEIGHAANFSVPGSGKTTITYAALSRWLEDGIINKILVIGPTSSFYPWEYEYKQCFKKPAYSLRPTGSQMNTLADLNHDIFLIHFATAWKKTEKIIDFLKKPENNVAVIVD